jgi:glycine/D-amino acid oxidase-like deaminating enzyme
VETVDIVVVGAGIIGSSIAYQLARRTSDRIVVLDKGAGPSEGSTGAPSAIVEPRPRNGRTRRHRNPSGVVVLDQE